MVIYLLNISCFIEKLLAFTKLASAEFNPCLLHTAKCFTLSMLGNFKCFNLVVCWGFLKINPKNSFRNCINDKLLDPDQARLCRT